MSAIASSRAPSIVAAAFRSRRVLGGLSAGLWLAIAIWALAAGSAGAGPILSLLALPTALAGIAGGLRGGVLASALSAAAVVALEAEVAPGALSTTVGVLALASAVCLFGCLAGALGESMRSVGRMTEREERMRRSLRAIVSRAIEGESRERARIAEEIHDGALQSLLVANQDLGQPGLDPDQVDRARLALLEAIEEIRLSLTELHPTSASEQGFERALEAEARKAAARGGFEATVDVDSDAVGYHDALIVSIARELLANVAKHAEAREAVLWLGRSGAGVELTVHDDGRGVDPQEVSRALATGHLGLMIVRERVEAMGGELVISVPPLGGTIVRVLIPLDAALTGEIARLEMALARSTYPPFGERHDPRLGGSEPPGEYPRSGG